MVTDYFFVYSYFFQREEKNEKNFWDMEIIGNKRKIICVSLCVKLEIVLKKSKQKTTFWK